MTIKIRIENLSESNHKAVVVQEYVEPTGVLDRVELLPGEHTHLYVYKDCTIKVEEGELAETVKTSGPLTFEQMKNSR